jgi:regulator of sigma E protease
VSKPLKIFTLAALIIAAVILLAIAPAILLAAFALGILIIVHELGHFLAAKHAGVWVERFSIGFGPKLLAKTRGDTEYCLCLVPLGGYVKLHRMLEEEPIVESREAEAFFNKPYGKKMYIITAGVIFNILFAVLLLAVKNMTGYHVFPPIVDNVQEDSAAAVAGFLPSDEIIAVDGQRIRSWEEFLEKLTPTAKYPIQVSVQRGAESAVIPFTPNFTEDKDIFGDDVLSADTGLSLYIPAKVGSLVFGMPAEAAGILAGDTIASINGEPVAEWSDVAKIMKRSIAQEEGAPLLQENVPPLTVEVERAGSIVALQATPKVMEDGSLLLGISAPAGSILIREPPHMALYHGFTQTVQITKLIYKGIGKLITGKVSKDNLGGPIMILAEGANSAKAGFGYYILFIALISINLGILNILPIPVLDGGYVVLFTVEKVTARKVGRFARECFQTAGLAMLCLLMVFAMYNDIVRFFFK